MSDSRVDRKLAARLDGIPVHGITGSLVSTATLQIILLFTGVVATRVLGPELRGYFAIFGIANAVAFAVSTMGTSSALTYFVSRNPDRTLALIVQLRNLTIVQCVINLLLVGLILYVFIADAPRSVQKAGLLTFPVGLSTYLNYQGLAIIQGMQRFALLNSLRLLPIAPYALLLGVTVAMGRDSLIAITGAWAVGSVIAAAAITYFVRDSMRPDSARDRETGTNPGTSEVLKYGLRGFIGTASPVEMFRIDQAAIGLALTPAALGLYAAANSFTNLPRLAAQSVGNIALPTVAASASGQEAVQVARRFIVLASIIATLLVATVYAMAPWLIDLFFGDEFENAVTVTRILLIGSFAASIRRITEDCARGMELPGIASLSEVSVWVTIVLSMPVLVRTYALNGAAASIAISSCVGLVTSAALLRRRSHPILGKVAE